MFGANINSAYLMEPMPVALAKLIPLFSRTYQTNAHDVRGSDTHGHESASLVDTAASALHVLHDLLRTLWGKERAEEWKQRVVFDE